MFLYVKSKGGKVNPGESWSNYVTLHISVWQQISV